MTFCYKALSKPMKPISAAKHIYPITVVITNQIILPDVAKRKCLSPERRNEVEVLSLKRRMTFPVKILNFIMDTISPDDSV